MSCYLRHLTEIIAQADLEPLDKKDRKIIDITIREIIGARGEFCNEVWKELKIWLAEPAREQLLVSELKKRIKKD
ncbi:MAG: hypothetical protein HGA27_00605 [Peptococcaceae bacterium]|nr:hypothetical protein [Peptococcaceae bacterium]